MTISLNERISFTSNPAPQARNRDKDAEKKIVAGGGAIAAKSGFDMFASASKVSKGKGLLELPKQLQLLPNKQPVCGQKLLKTQNGLKMQYLTGGQK